MTTMASQITSLTVVYSNKFRRRSKKPSKLRVTGLCVGNSPGPVNSPHKGSVTRKMFPFDDDLIMIYCTCNICFKSWQCPDIRMAIIIWRLKSPASRWFAQPFVSAQIIKAPRHCGLCEENSPSQRASNAENVSIWWRHHDIAIHLPVDYFFRSLRGLTSMGTWKLLITVPLWRESTGDQWIPLTKSQ